MDYNINVSFHCFNFLRLTIPEIKQKLLFYLILLLDTHSLLLFLLSFQYYFLLDFFLFDQIASIKIFSQQKRKKEKGIETKFMEMMNILKEEKNPLKKSRKKQQKIRGNE